MELCGCGIIQHQILLNSGKPDKIGWAFGLGMERIAMTMHRIPDIRLFWSNDPRFIQQFNHTNSNGKDVKYNFNYMILLGGGRVQTFFKIPCML